MALRFLTAGESHGPELVAVLEGMPAGLELDGAVLEAMLRRRQQGFGSGGRMRVERDRALITAGVLAGVTTGGPIALRIENRDHAAWAGRAVAPMTVPRPGHADLAAAVKYGYRDLRPGLERASARETAARVAVGAVCAHLLAAFSVRLGSYVTAVGAVVADLSDMPDHEERLRAAEASDVRCPDARAAEEMRSAIRAAARARDTLGGVFEVVALGVPPGLGSHVHWDRRLSGRLLGAVGSIPAVKGVELGPAFQNAARPGTQVHDRYALGGGGRILRLGGRGGGTEGGISTGEPIVVRAAMKPISTTLTPLPSVDLAAGRPAESRYERSDICAVPRAAVVGEAMVAFVLADALLEKLGGDSLEEMRPRFHALRQARLADLPMDDRPWRLGYARPVAEGDQPAEGDQQDADSEPDAG